MTVGEETTVTNIVFTLEEVNQMLEYLGNQPAKHSIDLITFIRSKAQSQLPVQEETPQGE